MAEKRKRSQNFTTEEKHKLVKLMYVYKNVILNKKTDSTTNHAKNEAWINLCTQYNCTGNMSRSKNALIRVWEKMKSEVKIYNSRNRSCTTGKGGGPSNIKTDPILEQVCDLVCRGCSGVASVLDSDSVMTIPINPDDLKGITEESQTIRDAELVAENSTNEVKDDDDKLINKPSCTETLANPLWKRRRPILTNKKIEIEDLKKKLLKEELEFKRNLYILQLESARKVLEIKTEVLNQIKSGNLNLNNLLGAPKNE